MRSTVLTGLCFFFLAKFLIAASISPFGDEFFYWQSGLRPSLTYVDHPPMTALMTHLGTRIGGRNGFGVRFFFLLAGVLFPFVIYHLARPFGGSRQAWIAAGLSALMPATAHLGILAIPDTFILLFSALYILAFERATRKQQLRWWLLAGLSGAWGLLTHYRFCLIPAAALIYLFITPRGRMQWRQKGIWICGILSSLGFAPSVYYNITHRFEPWLYYFKGRHSSSLHLEGLLEHIKEQLIFATPLIYIMLWICLFALGRKALRGNDRAVLLGLFAAVPILTFLLASPFHDLQLQTAHWPAPGYIALLAFLPNVLNKLMRGKPWRKVTGWATPALGGVVMLVAFLELGLHWPGIGSIRQPFFGWKDIVVETSIHLGEWQQRTGKTPVLVADHYKLGGALELAFHGETPVYVLNHGKNYVHGRQRQFDQWGIGEDGLHKLAGQEILLLVEWTQIGRGYENHWKKHLHYLFEPMVPIADFETVMPGQNKYRKRLTFFRATVQPKR